MDHIKGVFFDLHGTLLLSEDIDDAWERWAKAFHLAMEQRGAKITLDNFKKQLQNLFNGPEPEFDDPEFTLFMKRVKVLGERLNINIENREIRNLVDAIIRVWHQGMFLDNEALSVLQELKKYYSIGLITNWEHTPRIHELMQELNIQDIFDVVVVSESVGFAKPDPEIFTPVFNLTGVKPEESLYVGDMDVDVKAALNAGMQPVLIKRIESNGIWNQYSKRYNCEYQEGQVIIIKRLSQLLEIL
jgi:HAD superfamily hydrolase (TIGR01509 family)